MSLIDTAHAAHGGTTWIGRIAYNSDILTALSEFCVQHRIQTGWIQLIGALKRAELSYYDQSTHEYQSRVFEGAYEIVSGSGNISLKDGQPFVHLHVTLSDEEFRCFGGHLMPGGSEVFACEFILWPFQGLQPLHRQLDTTTGLSLWRN